MAKASGSSTVTMAAAAETTTDLRTYYQNEYPKQTWFLWGAFIGLLTVVRLIILSIRFIRRRRFTARPSSKFNGNITGRDVESRHRRVQNFTATLRIPIALINGWKIVWFRSTIDFGLGYTLNVTEAFLTIGYVVALLTWAFVNTHNRTVRWWENRTGTLAAAQFPLITALGTKNNILSLLTGVSHEQLNYLHRMTSRVACVLLLLHGSATIHRMFLDPVLHEKLNQGWARAGLTAATFLTSLVIVSVRPIRQRNYNIWVWVHFIVVLIFLVCAYFHTRHYSFDLYIWPCFIIWGLDRAVRVARIAYFALTSKPSLDTKDTRGNDTSTNPNATATLLSPQLLHLRVPRPPGFHWQPGQTAYLLLPHVMTLPCEAHPFSIACVDASSYNRAEHEPGEAGVESKSSSTTDLPTPVLACSDEDDSLLFLIGVHNGLTLKLAQLVAGSETGVARVCALVEGPYGHGVDLAGSGLYDSAVLVAGGTGVAWAMPVMIDAVKRAKELGDKSRLRRLVLIWTIRNHSHISWIARTLAQTLAIASTIPGFSISARVYVTAPPEMWDKDAAQSGNEQSDIGEQLETKTNANTEIEGLKVSSGRPNVQELIRGEIREGGREMFVGVCGSTSLASAVKAATRVNPFWGTGSVLWGGPSVELVVESFGYA